MQAIGALLAVGACLSSALVCHRRLLAISARARDRGGARARDGGGARARERGGARERERGETRARESLGDQSLAKGHRHLDLRSRCMYFNICSAYCKTYFNRLMDKCGNLHFGKPF